MAQEVKMNAEHINGDSSKTVSLSSFKAQLIFPAPKADEAVQFYKAAFGAEELNRANHSKRKAEQDQPLIICAELKIGTNSFIVCDQTDDFVAAVDGGGCGVIFRLEAEDVAGVVLKAVEAGAVADGEITELEGALLGKVEYQFSDANLISNDFLVKIMNKDPEGYVPMSVIASWKKIKNLGANNQMLIKSLRRSSKLVVSEDGK